MQVFFKFFFILTVSTIITPITRSQTIYYRDIFKGGVTGDGFIVGANSDTCFFSLNLNNAQNIKKAFLFCENRNNSISKGINFNGTNYEINENYDVNNQIDININGIFNAQIISRIVDVTQATNIGNNNYYLVPPSNQPSSGEDDIITGYYLLVLYENSLLPNVNFTVYQNNQNANNHYSFDLDNLNPININFPVGLALHTTDICNNITDGSIININGNELGIIGGIEPNLPTFCSGVSGSYYYENNTLFGLSGDTPDNSMGGADGLADINSYLTSNTEFNLSVYYQTQNSFLEKTNQVLDLFLTYTSTCEAFPVTVSNDTTICRNETVQLSASGGTHYLWQPSTDLSCVYCPNPVFSGDSSRFYTVRIWNNDSCSVVRPVKVNVRQLPAFSSITSTPSECNGATGKIISSANLNGETYSLNGGMPQNSGNFFNLAPGDYTLSLHELNGCTKDTVITVGSTISTNAFFTATPSQGAPPLWVNFTNLSENASNYAWFLNGDPQGNSFPSYVFDSTGNYTVTLVAWPNNPSCTDTFSLQIFIFDSLIVQVPNVFTPNNDQSNDVFGITTNSPVTVEYQLFNRWGNEMISGKNSLGNTTPLGLAFTPLWDGNNATEGTYFYQLTVTAQTPKGEQQRRLEGFFVIIR